MVRVLLSFTGALAACTPSPQEMAMHSPGSDPGTTAQNSDTAVSRDQASRASDPTLPGAGSQARAAQGPIPQPVSAAANPAPAPSADSPAEALGRRTLSTAFVRVGPDGHLTVERRDGRVLVLRDVVMRRKDYCGVQFLGGATGDRYCGGYVEVAAARAGGAPAPGEPDLAASNPIDSPRRPAERK